MEGKYVRKGEKHIFSLEEIEPLVAKNRFRITSDNRFKTRCIDGRYSGLDLPALATPGADAGLVMEIIAVNREYDLGLTHQSIEEIILSTVNGYDHFYLHTDTDHPTDMLGCGHINQVFGDPLAYQMDKSDVDYVKSFLVRAQRKGAKNTILEDGHKEGAVLILKGSEWSVAPEGKAFIYTQTLDDMRRKQVAHMMISYISEKLKIDEGYLYHILTQIADNQRMETVRRLASGLPIYEVDFEKNGKYTLKTI